MDRKELTGQAVGILVTDSLQGARLESAASDRADAARAAAGDVQAFERLYRTHLPRIHGLVRRMTGGHDADDLTQDVFVRAWRKLETFRGESGIGTWRRAPTAGRRSRSCGASWRVRRR